MTNHPNRSKRVDDDDADAIMEVKARFMSQTSLGGKIQDCTLHAYAHDGALIQVKDLDGHVVFEIAMEHWETISLGAWLKEKA